MGVDLKKHQKRCQYTELWNSACNEVLGANEDGEIAKKTPFGAVAHFMGIPVYCPDGHTDYGIEARTKVAVFLRHWADELEADVMEPPKENLNE